MLDSSVSTRFMPQNINYRCLKRIAGKFSPLSSHQFSDPNFTLRFPIDIATGTT